MSTSQDGRPPIDLVVVASWFPGGDDPARGRFVADQAEALRDGGRFRPVIATFDPARVDRDLVARPQHAGAIRRHLVAALESRDDAVNPHAGGAPSGMPIARPPVAEPVGTTMPDGQEAELRREALLMLLDRLPLGSGPGIVHAHTAYPDGYAAAGLARTLGWPLVITEHASFVARQLRQPGQRKRYLEAVDAASRFIAVSDTLAGELLAAIPELGGKLRVMPNAISLEHFTPVGLDQRRAEELLFVGYRKERKGMVTLLRAFADVHEQRPGATLRLVGRSLSEAEEDRWRELAADLGIAAAVTFDAPADRTGVAAAMRRASLFVHPSPRETFGITTLEALASGLPVVSTRSGGISSILDDAALGELVPPQDSRALARAVVRALDRRESFDPQALRAAVEPYSATTIARRLGELYEEVLGEAAPGRAEGVRPPAPADRSPAARDGAPWNPGTLVIAFDTARAAAVLGPLPANLLESMTLVTYGGEAAEELPASLNVAFAATEVDAVLHRLGLHGPRGTLRDRIQRFASNPFTALRRRLTPGGLTEVRWHAAVAGATATVRRLADGGGTNGVRDVVCLDGLDYLIGEALVSAGLARSTPGGILWLADRWASAQSLVQPSRSSTAEASRAPTTLQS